METKNIDIAIIGAGLTGLTSAFWLTRSGKQIQIIETSVDIPRRNRCNDNIDCDYACCTGCVR